MDFDFTNGEELTIGLMHADLEKGCQEWAHWKNICTHVDQSNPDGQAWEELKVKYAQALIADPEKLGQIIWTDQMENSILGSFAAFKLEIAHAYPMVAWAAESRRRHEGLDGEIANLRTLLVMGLDPNRIDPDTGEAALHKVCAMEWGPSVHLRALDALTDAGANPNLKDKAGASPFHYLCGAHPYTQDALMGQQILMRVGADPFQMANDGMNALDVLKMTEGISPNGSRLQIIKLIETDMSAFHPVARPYAAT